jgi:membrane carboxypeptidase/penicillin-binding protein
MPDAENQRPQPAREVSNVPDHEAGERKLSALDKTHSDADHSASDADQVGADSDQSASDADQAIADRDQRQALPDSASWHAYEASRRQRIKASAGRTGASAERDASAVIRASTSRARTEGAAQRDEAAFEDEVRRRTAEQVEHERAVLSQAEELAGAGEQLFADQSAVRVIPAEQGRVGLDLARAHQPGLILLDLHRGRSGGFLTSRIFVEFMIFQVRSDIT